MTRRKPPHRRPNHMTPAERAEALRLYAAGETRNGLADRYDRDIRTIDALITRFGAQRKRSVLTVSNNALS